MSASREKKGRQDDPNQGLTQKQLKERKEAAVKKRNKIVYAIIGVIAAVLIAALLIWHSGIFQKKTIAATVGDQQFTVVDLNYYYYQAINQQYNMYQQYAAYGLTPPFDLSKPLDEQYVDEAKTQTYQQQFHDTALESLKQSAALCAEAKKAGYTLSADGQKEYDAVLTQIDQICAKNNMTRSAYLIRSYGKYMTDKVFERNLANDVLASDFQKSHQDALTYTDDQIQGYYKENMNTLDSFDFRYFMIDGTAPAPTDADGNPKTDADGNAVEVTDEEKAAALAEAKNKADAALAEIKAAGGTEKAFTDAAAKYISADQQESYQNDPDKSLAKNQVGSSFASQPYAGWITESRKTGDTTAIETETGYYVMMFLSRTLDEAPTANIRHVLIQAAVPADDPATADKDESQDAPTTEALATAKTEAQTLLDQWSAGDKTEDSFGAIAKERSADTGSAQNGGLIEGVYQGQTFAGFNDWVLDPARKTGDVTLMENPQAGQQGWHIIYFQSWGDPVWKSTSDNALRSKDQSDWMTKTLEPYTAEAADGMKQVGN